MKMKVDFPDISLHGEELHYQMLFTNGQHKDREIRSIKTFVRKEKISARKNNPDREITPLSIENPHGNVFRGRPNAYVVAHIKIIWKKFSIGVDEILVVEVDIDSTIVDFEIEASFINNAKSWEDDCIYLVKDNDDFQGNWRLLP
jgi:hypothetical protein